MKLKPLGDRLLVRPLETVEKSKSGIVLPDTAREKPQEGEVLAVGEGKYIDGRLTPLSVRKGDKVLFSKYGGDEIKVEGEELKILQESDILAIIE
ncbi:co-chaperone GroES [Candidatus Berkelbacteria bacterium RIFCSPHIGHO2_12_FULL_36_9]|uniref:Co-chaperonin GroES n=1 Tax=Candidatus Berkelbacteria bacterium RIFCSPHIGHO2_12_FULL_36_9 TaxID=1797469 RepID=A0A1F5EKD9_9BACT|nr:MAG: co-chaperone GroES [Candidatus Berkelbacteria bacterium RIFCSPHIGHO2_12_FULL_36_9]